MKCRRCRSRLAMSLSEPVLPLSWNSTGPTRTPTPTLGMRVSCNFVNVYTIAYRVQYTFTRVQVRIPNGHRRENPLEDKRACRTSRRTSRRGSSCLSGSWQAERGSRRRPDTPTSSRRSSRGSGEDVRVRVYVGPLEFQLYALVAGLP